MVPKLLVVVEEFLPLPYQSVVRCISLLAMQLDLSARLPSHDDQYLSLRDIFAAAKVQLETKLPGV